MNEQIYDIILEHSNTVFVDYSCDIVTESIGDFLKAVLDKTLVFIENIFIRIKNTIKNLLVTNKGFEVKLKEWKKTFKPFDKITVEGYQYDFNKLHPYVEKFKNAFESMIKKVSNRDDNNPLYLPLSDFQKEFVKLIDSECSTYEDIYKVMKKEFLGEKKERTITVSEYPEYEKISLGHKTFNNEMNALHNQCKASIHNSMKIINLEATNSRREKAQTKCNNVSNLIKAFSHFSFYYNTLFTDYVFFCRKVCTRFYN